MCVAFINTMESSACLAVGDFVVPSVSNSFDHVVVVEHAQVS